MVNSSTSPRPRLKIVTARFEGRVPINVVYSRHIDPHARLGTSPITLVQATLNLILPIVGVLFIPNKLFRSDCRWCRTI
jgi:hypothetical protein